MNQWGSPVRTEADLYMHETIDQHLSVCSTKALTLSRSLEIVVGIASRPDILLEKERDVSIFLLLLM